MKLVLSVLLTCALLPGIVASSPRGSAGTTNIAQLRKMFVQKFGADFELLSDRVGEVERERYWIVTARAKRSGTFTFRYKFQRVNYGYKYGDNEYHLEVGDKGCKRMLFFSTRPDICVGDSIILHFQISDYVVNHTFTNVSSFPTYFTSSYTGMEGLQDEVVANPLGQHLKYLGRTVRSSIRRDLRYSAVDFSAIFEAANPGKVDLVLSADVPDALGEFHTQSQGVSFHMVVVPEGEPITTVVGLEHIWESDYAPDESHKPRSSSFGSRTHGQEVLMLHAGDRISLTYGAMSLPTRSGMEELSLQVKPVIKAAP